VTSFLALGDCYDVFTRLVQRGELPENWESLQRELDAS
jgi:hypothetical protein